MSTDPGQKCSYDYDCSGDGGETSSTNVNVSVGSNRSTSRSVRSSARREQFLEQRQNQPHSVMSTDCKPSPSIVRKLTLAAGVLSPYLLSLSGVFVAYPNPIMLLVESYPRARLLLKVSSLGMK